MRYWWLDDSSYLPVVLRRLAESAVLQRLRLAVKSIVIGILRVEEIQVHHGVVMLMLRLIVCDQVALGSLMGLKVWLRSISVRLSPFVHLYVLSCKMILFKQFCLVL